ncbi:BMC domain-containing protein [Enterobacteriaceae bacterium BIT-l23]|uniref:BMC domain-containing protein n=1 Tax=Jejubacter sp. L23 TaxID=3092086 RepID=UPI001584ACA0|nr:BMC domain-containing protein [Enterobacteriaceae bacterium BIT-l23]
MKSLGVIETQGFVAAIQAVDAACKAASVVCIGYRKVGAGLVSVYFEGEISAIHTAIARGCAVAGINHPVNSLVIARPEPAVIDTLSTIKGRPATAARSPAAAADVAVEPKSVQVPITQTEEGKSTALKKGKKA